MKSVRVSIAVDVVVVCAQCDQPTALHAIVDHEPYKHEGDYGDPLGRLRQRLVGDTVTDRPAGEHAVYDALDDLACRVRAEFAALCGWRMCSKCRAEKSSDPEYMNRAEGEMRAMREAIEKAQK